MVNILGRANSNAAVEEVQGFVQDGLGSSCAAANAIDDAGRVLDAESNRQILRERWHSGLFQCQLGLDTPS